MTKTTKKMNFPIHWLSKEARFKIIDLLLSTRSIRQLAEELGISTTAVRKYINRKTHPSDNTVERALEIMAPYEEEKLVKIIIDDLAEALKRLYESIDKRVYKEYLLNKLREAVKEIEE